MKEICEHIDIENVIAGCYNPKDSRTDPFEVLSGFRKYLKNTDIEIKERTKVKNIKINNNDKLVKTNKGLFKTENIINASGGWAPKIGKMMGIDIPIKPYKHQILVTEPYKK